MMNIVHMLQKIVQRRFVFVTGEGSIMWASCCARQVRMLSELADGLLRRRLRFVISNPSERVFAMLERSGLLDTIGALLCCAYCS